MDAINRATDKRGQLERQLADLTDQVQNAGEPGLVAAPVDADSSPVQGPVQGGTAQQLATYRSLLASYQQRGWTDQHPDVVRVKRMIATLEQKADAEMLQAPVSAAAGPAAVAAKVSPAEQQHRAKIESVRLEMDQIDKTVAAKETEQKQLRAEAANLQAAIDAVPAHESELTDLMRDHATLETLYTGLLTKTGAIQDLGQSRVAGDRPAVQGDRCASPTRAADESQPRADQRHRAWSRASAWVC